LLSPNSFLKGENRQNKKKKIKLKIKYGIQTKRNRAEMAKVLGRK